MTNIAVSFPMTKNIFTLVLFLFFCFTLHSNNAYAEDIVFPKGRMSAVMQNKTIEGEIMDLLKLNKYCCRRHMLTHVDIE